MRKILSIAVATLAVAGCNDTATTNQQSGADNDMTTQSTAAIPMSDYASAAAIGDMYEIESSRLALTKSNNPETKRFAERMITDHTRTSDALKALVRANGNAVTLPTELDSRRQSLMAQLENASGDAFDRLYFSQQQAAHDEALSLHRGFAEGGDNAEARALAQNAADIVQQHHSMLRTSGSGTGAMESPTTATGTPSASSGNQNGTQSTTTPPSSQN